jgi:putative addiction module component (TIGR02574 family)
MTETAERLKPELERLSPQDRAALARFLISSLDAEEDMDTEGAWSAELERRWGEIENGEVAGESADEVLAKLHRKYS